MHRLIPIAFIIILDKETPSDEYSPDEFSSQNKKLKLEFGHLEPEIYIEMNYED